MNYRKIGENFYVRMDRGDVVRDDKGQLFHHTHALFSFKKDGLGRYSYKDLRYDKTDNIRLRRYIG